MSQAVSNQKLEPSRRANMALQRGHLFLGAGAVVWLFGVWYVALLRYFLIREVEKAARREEQLSAALLDVVQTSKQTVASCGGGARAEASGAQPERGWLQPLNESDRAFAAHASLASEYYQTPEMQGLRTEVFKILEGTPPTCSTQWPTSQIFYNRIGKAGSESLSDFFSKALQKSTNNLKSLAPSDRGSDEFLSQSGELELMQKLIGNDKLKWMPSTGRSIMTYHAFFINFTKWSVRMPIYINLLREPGARWVSQYEFWKTLPDIGRLTREHAVTLDVCLTRKGIACPPLNYQTSYFCGHEPDCHDPPDDASFLVAVRHMVQNYAAIGVLEELGAFERQLMHMFPQWFDVSKASAVNDRERANQNKNSKKKSPEMMRRVRAANNYDTLLYQVALELFHKRAAACSVYPQRQ